MKSSLLTVFIVMLVFVGCDDVLTVEPADNELLDGFVDGLSPTQTRAFLAGDAAFAQVFTPETGLGPYFVTSSCTACHPGDGKGHLSSNLTRFGKSDGFGGFDPMILQGGPQLQNRAIPGFIAESIPSDATGVTQFTAPAVTGLGFLESVPDASIVALADPTDENGDGISGVPNYIKPPDFFVPKAHHISVENKYIGRFGKKAGAINLLMQTVGAYKQDMGITTDFDTEDPINYAVSDLVISNVDGPEVSSAVVNQVVFYLGTLKKPVRRDENDPEVLDGERIFSQINCTACHMHTLKTGNHVVESLSNKEFHPYTDLLMHDMGPALDDGYTEGTATTSEWKTPALWGIGLSPDAQGGGYFLMHDGRAKSLEEAILLHGGEGAASAEAYAALSAENRGFVVKFLESL